ncbi:MAG TPA: hypothetical protein EYQ80_02220 [Candidatus Poseidoniales archaeon]|jgi:hypothetical protein|nr:hypothetical protein [Candidatus Poseidoniales archaeon]
MSDEIGSVMMDAEEELVMPEIPVKANNAIPVAIGILLVIGSLFGALLSASMMLTLTVDDEARDQAGFGPEENATLDLLQETGLAETLTIMYGGMTLGLLIGGIMLMRKNPLGVKVSLFGSSMFILTNLVQVVWTYLAADMYGISFSLGADLIIFFGCGAFCMALPLLTVILPEGRAALYREPVGIYFGEEE